MLEGLGEALRGTLKKIANAPYIDASLIKEVVQDIQRALIQADVNVQLVLKISKNIEKRALEEKPLPGMSNREHVIRIVHDELSSMLGKGRELPLKKQVIMMVGLYGQGKTTTCGKLARYFQKKGLRPALIAGDVHRPAAYEQLKQIGEKINTPVHGGGKDAVKVVKEGLEKFKKYDVIIVDTSGRHSLEKDLIKEMKEIFKVAKPDEKILVMDAATGQQAGPQAKAFNDAIGITGVILTKMDGTAKGGGALSAVAETGAPFLYIGTGEHLDDLEKFDSTRFLSRLLGMGDIQSLLEKAEEAAKMKDKKKMEKAARNIMSGRFTLKDMYEQMEMVANMGPLQKIVEMLPGGFGEKLKKEDMHQTQERLKKFRVIMDSMTEKEMEEPHIIKSSRAQRIARGAGVEVKDVKELLKYYNMSKKMMKGLSSKKMQRRLMQQLNFG
ncbi:signal recognition particle protein [Thermoplasmatales archaeon ex4484_30]|nr:MAG: signal recognition particle protein [Thermoplasmatales archaeon ex4484_30]